MLIYCKIIAKKSKLILIPSIIILGEYNPHVKNLQLIHKEEWLLAIWSFVVLFCLYLITMESKEIYNIFKIGT